MELLLYNLRTGKTRTLARGYNGGAWIEPGQVSCSYATWSRGREQPSGNDVFLHDIPAHETVTIPRGAPFQFSPPSHPTEPSTSAAPPSSPPAPPLP